ncbi:hypothetical protein CEXT_556681 [Caerostris extrusa]|uniref:Uncharacterized protein n=1 Tax=Caerostris extrusa TaxID=172846 RepID=A0AAV4S6G4_CAEEX|nr:hypothetical protein CEXT_556681 [Caerostris extrusa]
MPNIQHYQKKDVLELHEFSFGMVSCLVAVLTSTSSKENQSLVSTIVPRFSVLTGVCLEVLWRDFFCVDDNAALLIQ